MRLLPSQIRRTLDFLREQEPELHAADDLFAAVLELAEYLAAQEHLISAAWAFEPDHLVARILRDPESDVLRAVDQILGGLSGNDLERLEAVLVSLEQRHGMVRSTPAGHRILIDGAILGRVAFTYSRKFREVLSTRTIHDPKMAAQLFPELFLRVDDIFTLGRPSYLWRLGPEFGSDRNIEHLLDRRDDFIVHGLYRSRAKRLARGVERWLEVPGERFIGENCSDLVYREPARVLVVRWKAGRRQHYGTLVSTLSNVPWEEIYRFYNNRSCKRYVEIPRTGHLKRRVAASLLILTLFTYRNFRSWAWASPGASAASVAVSESEQTKRELQIIEHHRPTVLERMEQYIELLKRLTGGEGPVPSIAASPLLMDYQIFAQQEAGVPLLADGKVVHVDRHPATGLAIVIDHGGGFSSHYSNLESIHPDVMLGAELSQGHQLGTLAPGSALHLAPRMSARYLELSIQPSVAEILAREGNLLLDPLGLLTPFTAGTTGEPGAVVEAAADRPPRFPDLEEADAYRFSSTELAGETIIVAGAEILDELEFTPLAEAFDDEITVDVLGEEIS